MSEADDMIRELVSGLHAALEVIEANWEVIRPIMTEEEIDQHDHAGEALQHGMAWVNAIGDRAHNT